MTQQFPARGDSSSRLSGAMTTLTPPERSTRGPVSSSSMLYTWRAALARRPRSAGGWRRFSAWRAAKNRSPTASTAPMSAVSTKIPWQEEHSSCRVRHTWRARASRSRSGGSGTA